MDRTRFKVGVGVALLATTIAVGAGCCHHWPKLPKDTSLTGDTVVPTQPDRVGTIVLEGNSLTQDRVILGRLGFVSGDTVDEKKLRKAETELMRLGIFDVAEPPSITVVSAPDGSKFKNIVVRVKETTTGVVWIGLGIQSNAGYGYVTPSRCVPAGK